MTKIDLAPLTIADTNLSHAWGRILLHMFDSRVTEIKPLMISLTGFNRHGKIEECPYIRNYLDKILTEEPNSVETPISAFTIFPESYWQISDNDREKFYEICRDALPRIKAKRKSINRHGLYFERMMFYGRGNCNGNQLEWIIQNHRRGMRNTMYQASIFDPERDHVPNPRLVFPCLQHVSFVKTDDGLVLNAFYATQLLVHRAYGNLLGLNHLGAFMADQLGMRFAQLNMMVGQEKLGGRSKKGLQGLKDVVSASLSPAVKI